MSTVLPEGVEAWSDTRAAARPVTYRTPAICARAPIPSRVFFSPPENLTLDIKTDGADTAPVSIADRFKGDILPDNTYGICKIHSPAGSVRLVGDDGKIAANGICQFCYLEAHDESFFTCPIHGINPKVAGRPGCPVDGCLGESPGPTPQEIEREALAISRVWPGGPLKVEATLAETPAGSQNLGAGEDGDGARAEAREVPDDGAVRAGAPAASTGPEIDYERLVLDPQGVPVQPQGRAEAPHRLLDATGRRWVSPFMIEEDE